MTDKTTRLDQAAGASIGGFFSKTDESKPEQTIKASKRQTKTAERMEQIPTFYNMGITSPEVLGEAIAEALKEPKPIHKGTISTLMTNIKETQPDRLTEPPEELPIDEQRKLLEEYRNQSAQKRTEPPQTTQKPQTTPELPQPIKSTPEEEKPVYVANTKPQKAVMGFRAEVDKIELWKLYADAAELEISTMCVAAIDEYISNHELAPDQKEIFDIKKQALEAEKAIKSRKKNNS